MAQLVVTILDASSIYKKTNDIGSPKAIATFRGTQVNTEVQRNTASPQWNEDLIFNLESPIRDDDCILVQVVDESQGRQEIMRMAEISLSNVDVCQKGGIDLQLKLKDDRSRNTDSILNLLLSSIDDSKQRTSSAKNVQLKKGAFPYVQAQKELSSKREDFQVRITVIKARNLVGMKLDPIARVDCCRQFRQTKVVNNSSSPYWDETFSFNLYTSSTELAKEILTFSVFDSRTLRANALIGSFKYDLGNVLKKTNIVNKWLLLSELKDNSASCKGYLQVSVWVLSASDPSPDVKLFKTVDVEADDIESNLLKPAGIEMIPASFSLRLYRAEDFPTLSGGVIKGMFSANARDPCSPCVLFKFAGNSTASSIKYKSAIPEWNEELYLNIHWPSMCSSICLRVLHGSKKNEDEPLGTVFLDLSTISAEGVDASLLTQKSGEGGDEPAKQWGFLPTYGPCFVNIYGAPREAPLTTEGYIDFNRGRKEGVAYRGRILVELAMNVGEISVESKNPISKETISRTKSLMRRRKFRLVASFISASMLMIKDAPVYFEVSIGNFGNSFDSSVPPSSSTTPPTNPVFDGSNYHFLPWLGEKPCAVVDAQWEDISYRLFTVNLINKIVDRIESNIDKIDIAVAAKLPQKQQAEFVIASFDEIILQCSQNKSLPHQSKTDSLETDLDVKLRTLREAYISCVYNDAMTTRESLTSIQEGCNRLRDYRDTLKAVASEAQNSIPDVIICMMTGKERIAYYRIPATEVIYSENYDYRGRYCGMEQTVFLQSAKIENDEDPGMLPCLLRVKLWFGLLKHYHVWQRANPEGEISIRAETYENQMNVFGRGWSATTGGVSRPPWSDPYGSTSLPKEDFEVPIGWQWDGDWFCAPECSLYYNFDAACTEIFEDIFYHEVRASSKDAWRASSKPYTDLEGNTMPSPQDRLCPTGWAWSGSWRIDYNRACDEDGWEYAVDTETGGYIPVSKIYHLVRRRRFVRLRIVEGSGGKTKLIKKLPDNPDHCWEYSTVFSANTKFHATPSSLDMVRRRRWHRKMTSTENDAPSFIKVEPGVSKGEAARQILAAPRMIMTPHESHKWQMRAHIYQARDLPACTPEGMSNPYARVAFVNNSACTKTMKLSLSPMWDQTLILDNILIYSNPSYTLENPPHVVIEIFSRERLMEDYYLGRCAVSPMVKTDIDDPRQAVLHWFKLKRDDCPSGELLAAFELILVDDKTAPCAPPRKGDIFTIPSGIRPILKRTGIEILCWGVRDMKKFQMSHVNNPEVEFEVGSFSVRSDSLNNASEDPNFPNPWIFLDVMLPREELYLPPMNVRVRDRRKFGRTPLVGVHIVKDLENFRVKPKLNSEVVSDIFAELERHQNVGNSSDSKSARKSMRGEAHERMYQSKCRSSVDMKQLDKDSDWWSKYYASTGDQLRSIKYSDQYSDKIMVYKTELENVEEYNGFNDFLTTFKITRGRNLEEGDNLEEVGELKGVVKVYSLPDDRRLPMPAPYLKTGLPENRSMNCIIRVYVIQAFNLQATDYDGGTDPFVSVSVGDKQMDNRDNYIPNSLNPVFGRMFELKCNIPSEKELRICVKDRDLILADELIGETKIDLEDRVLSRFRATVGLPMSYCLSGPNMWRDSLTPLQILNSLCEKHGMKKPEVIKDAENEDKVTMRIGKSTFNLSDFESNSLVSVHWGTSDQRLALHVLRILPLVKEHVEMRALYNDLQPGIEQGRLQMFVDIFPTKLGAPGPPVDIRPREPELYYLRVVIYNTIGLRMKKVLSRMKWNKKHKKEKEKMVDLYCKGWIAGVDEVQKTDVHYRAVNGEGNFNWRFVFPFYFLTAENVMVVKKKANFWSIDLTETKMPANLVIQVWDNDYFGPDDFLGTLELPLSSMAFPVKEESKCSLEQLPEISKERDPDTVFDIFESLQTNGYWPMYVIENGNYKMMGKVEMEIEVISEEQAKERPAGQGREEPNCNPFLAPPNRPDSSFRWFTSPWKTFRYIIWRRHRVAIVTSMIVSLLASLIGVFCYAIPDTAARRMLGGSPGKS